MLFAFAFVAVTNLNVYKRQNPLKWHRTEQYVFLAGPYVFLSYDPHGPARAFIAKLLRKSPYEGRTH